MASPHEHHSHAPRRGHDHGHGRGDGHGGHGHAHGASDKMRVLTAAVLTGGFMIAEAIGGWITGSLALLADAGHMLTDTVSLVLAWYAFQLAGREATTRLSYGFDRMKTLVAYTNGLAIFVIGAWIVWEAVERISSPAPVLGGPMLVVAVVGLFVNVAAFFVLHGGDRQNLNMRGAMLHVVGDLLGSVAALVAAGVILLTGWMPIDPILSVLVALLLFRSAAKLVMESGQVLLEGTPPKLDPERIASDLARSIKGVREIHHLHVWSLDGSKNMATLHACLTEGTDPHAAVSAIKQRLARRHGIEHATVEPEFGECADIPRSRMH